jgi:LmbE family N-acetylglucosaminyl deacetylase
MATPGIAARDEADLANAFPFMKSSSRRTFFKGAAAGLGVLSLGSSAIHAGSPRAAKFLKVACVGAHPGDPEAGPGGTLALFSAAGHSVSNIYFTRGEAGVLGKTHEEAAAIRTGEALDACKILGAKPVFAGQIDGASVVDNEWVIRMERLIAEENPDLVFAHWPIDSHKDHQCASLLTVQVWMRAKVKFELYFFEVGTGVETMTFHPTDYVDITQVQELKRRAVFCHVSQNPPKIYKPGVPGNQAIMEEYRGMQLGVRAAEAFVKMVGHEQGNTIDGL